MVPGQRGPPGRPHLLYAETQADTLKYAYWDGVQWQIETAAGNAYYSALALDSSGQAHVAYYDLLAYDLIYGWREP